MHEWVSSVCVPVQYTTFIYTISNLYNFALRDIRVIKRPAS